MLSKQLLTQLLRKQGRPLSSRGLSSLGGNSSQGQQLKNAVNFDNSV